MSDTPIAEMANDPQDDVQTSSAADGILEGQAEGEQLTKEQRDEIIDDAKKYLELVDAADDGNREEQIDDLEFLAGEHWDPAIVTDRERTGRPCLVINKLPTFLHQVTNDQRMNVPSIKVSPVSGGATVKKAEIIQGMVRHVEYASNADIAYDTAVNSAAAIGQGFFGLVTDFCRPDSFDQDIRFRRFRNSFTVAFDPTSQEPDGSDQKRCLISSKMPRKAFEREYPEAEATTQGISPLGRDATLANWVGEDFVRLAEFYRIEETQDTLLELSDGSKGYESDLQALNGVQIVRRRKTTRLKTMWYKITALDVLEFTEIKCKWIPVFPVFGDELDIDGDIIRSGIIRHAKDPSAMYDYWMTAATEEVALRPKVPFIGAEGQFEGYEDEWNQANNVSFPFLQYKPVGLEGVLAPPPQRQQMADIPSGMLTMSMHANDNIKATTGLFDSSLGAKGNATSGIQERSQQRQGDMANFHFTDNLNRSVRHAGRCIIDMIPHYYDATRVVRIMGEDGKISSAEINRPLGPNEQPPKGAEVDQRKNGQTQAIEQVLNDLTIGEYDVVVKAGPSYSTLRQEAVENMIELGGKWPKILEVAGDKVIRAMDWPGAEEIADRLEKTIPPELRDGEDGEETENVVRTPKGDIPVNQAAQMLQEMDQQIQSMAQELQSAKSGIDKARVDADSREKVAEINAVSRNDVEELKGWIQIQLAKMQPPPILTAKALDTSGGDVSQSDPTAGSIPPTNGALSPPVEGV